MRDVEDVVDVVLLAADATYQGDEVVIYRDDEAGTVSVYGVTSCDL